MHVRKAIRKCRGVHISPQPFACLEVFTSVRSRSHGEKFASNGSRSQGEEFASNGSRSHGEKFASSGSRSHGEEFASNGSRSDVESRSQAGCQIIARSPVGRTAPPYALGRVGESVIGGIGIGIGIGMASAWHSHGIASFVQPRHHPFKPLGTAHWHISLCGTHTENCA
ncbi:hypothetical protein AC579_8535 [Pseudocercospora musae]|uniref:Uncharacterized protein n=1 Tax=Pseudocercospora musae TaxID=113226 RepID=A0A139GTA9_9PEZI|nr:hypothetical protein AC579_8535 [Pseudocercospora musae]